MTGILHSFVLIAVALAAAPASAAQDRSSGVWRNPGNSVHIRAHPCGKSMCGTVMWANDKAKADARRGGTETLIGAQLFSGFVPAGRGVWRGKVFVPDIGKTFSGTITVINDITLKGEGCLLGRIVCKSQVWTRMDQPGQ